MVAGDDLPPRSLRFAFPAVGELAAGKVRVSVRNRDAGRASVWVVQYPPVPEEAALVEFEPLLSAKRLLSSQTFRRLFRSETVPAAEGLHVRDLTFLFTDLKDSTLVYETVGDVNAYNLVRRHFDALLQAVGQNSGAVVKTIGDAVMATFVSPADAVRAALDMQSALAEFDTAGSAELILKIGIHRGRSIAVTLNDRIDYFGQTVNVAARVQQLAGAGDIVLSADVYRQPDVADLLEGFEVVEESGVMKGVEETIPVFRVRSPRS
jgi:class 3 adenylate cyclase